MNGLSRRVRGEELRRRLPLPVLMELMGIGAHAKKSALCPLHSDSRESFSLYQNPDGLFRWKCHAGCGGGGEVDLIARLEGLSIGDAFRRWESLAGGGFCHERREPVKSDRIKGVAFPADFHFGVRHELETVARLRGVSLRATAQMHVMKVLGFGTVHGFPSWIVFDQSGRCAEARRMDGLLYPSFSGGSPRKVHSLRGSHKGWPVGLRVDNLEDFQRVLIVEGSGDLVAGYHFAEQVGYWLPVAVLGASVGALHPEALSQLRWKHVRVVPHVDPAGAQALDRICNQLHQAGCQRIDWFDLSRCRTAAGGLVKDLNDCVNLAAGCAAYMEGLLK